jgi:ferric-dicitrate binding protein FerR (iron transport regulator)
MSFMNRKNDDLERGLAEINGEDIDPRQVEEAAARVWARLTLEASGNAPVVSGTSASTETPAPSVHSSLKSCEDFQSLIPAYLRGELSPARALLVEDHTRSCIPCRRALREARDGRKATAVPAAATRSQSRPVWMSLAALLLVGLGFGLFFAVQTMFYSGQKMARVESVEGSLYRIQGEKSIALAAGTPVIQGEEIRTAKGSTALVRMNDGSLIEMSERAGLSMVAAVKGNTINLERGRIIVQAAKQRPHHLYVATNDCLVSVTGTIFAVNHGTKGSRVSVVEGEVHVRQSAKESILHPGGQVTTHASVSAVPVRQEIAWSRNAAQYESLLAELKEAGQDIDRQVARPGVRTSSRLLDLAPAGTKAWIGLPNLGTNLDETQRVLDQKIAESPALQQWWNDVIGSAEKNAKFHEMIDKLGAIGRNLGGEIGIALVGDLDGDGENGHHDGYPVILAEVTNEAAFRAVLEQELAAIDHDHQGSHSVHIVTDLAQVPTGEGDGLYLWIGGGLFVATPDGGVLRTVVGSAGGTTNPFVTARFHDRVAQEYRDGAGWLFAADLGELVGKAQARTPEEQQKAEKLGFLDLEYLIINRREADNKAETRAALTFDHPRRGVASWLAAPAPMGTLGFFSPDANLVTAFVVRQPVSLIDDLINVNPDFAAELEKLRTEKGFDLRNDLAAPMGGEIALGIDGPLLPSPSWKLVAEVYDPARLQLTFERAVQQINDELRKEGKPVLEIHQDHSGTRTFYSIEAQHPKIGVHYLYEDGYLVAAGSRALLDRALQYRASGVTLATAPKFRDLLGADGQVNVSAFFYQNLGPVLDQAAKVAPQGTFGPNGSAPGRMASLLIGQGPTLVYAYAEEDRILFASKSESPLGLNLQTLAGFGGVLGMMNGDHGHGEAAAETSR